MLAVEKSTSNKVESPPSVTTNKVANGAESTTFGHYSVVSCVESTPFGTTYKIVYKVGSTPSGTTILLAVYKISFLTLDEKLLSMWKVPPYGTSYIVSNSLE